MSVTVSLGDSDTQPSASRFPLLTEQLLSHRILMEIIRVPEKLEHIGKEPFLPHGKSCSSWGSLGLRGSSRYKLKLVFLSASLLGSVGKSLFAS